MTMRPPLCAGQEAAQPGDRVGVEVVGRLVEQQGAAAVLARVAEQDAGQLDAAALAAGEGADGLGQHPVGQPQVGADPGGLGLGRVPAERRRTGPRASRSGGPGRRVGSSASLASMAFISASRAVQAPGGQHPVAGGDLEVAGTGVLRQVADGAAAVDRARRTAEPSPASTFSVVVLPAPLRPTRPIRSPGCTRRVVSASRMREPARSSRPVAVIIVNARSRGEGLTQGTRKRRPGRFTRRRRGGSVFAEQHGASVPAGPAEPPPD